MDPRYAERVQQLQKAQVTQWMGWYDAEATEDWFAEFIPEACRVGHVFH